MNAAVRPAAVRSAAMRAATSIAGRLDALDRSGLPPASRAAAWLRDRAVAIGRRGGALRRAAAGVAAPGEERGLLARRLDRGARVIVVAVVGIVGVAALGGFVDARPHGPRVESVSGPGVSRTSSPPLVIGYVGTAGSAGVEGYVAAASLRLATLAGSRSRAELYAVVSFPGYRTPAQVVTALAGYPVVRAFFRVPPDGGLYQAEVGDPALDIDAAFLRAASLARDAASDSREVPSAAVRAAEQARALSGSCACVYGAVVRATVVRLEALSAAGSVRLVDTALPGEYPGPTTQYVPLRPEQR